MTESRTITIPHLGRVEGHGGIFVTLEGTSVADVDMNIHEGSRYYEALLKGKHYLEVQGIITRVCAICSADHTVAALSAIEDALGVTVSERTLRLRDLLLLGAAIESHALHVFALALPDYLGFESMISMAREHPTHATFALKLKQLGNRIQDLVGGRPIHPVNALIGGFGRLPRHRKLDDLRVELVGTLDPLLDFVDFVATIDVPYLDIHPTTYVALLPAGEGYGFRGDVIHTSRGSTHPVTAYREVVREFTVGHSHAKFSRLAGGMPYMVGALARLALWSDRLHDRAREVFDHLFPAGVTDNALFNNQAQVVEIVHCIERSVELIDLLLATPERVREVLDHDVRAGRGVSAVEVPRGTLFHEYVLDDDGRVTDANVVTPTAQNLANLERDLRHAAQSSLASPDSVEHVGLKHTLEMIARAYDPCISCSVHVVRVPSRP